MAGVKGRSGRKPKPLQEHVLSGTYRRDRHGPLPPAMRATVLQGPGASTVGATALSMPAPSIPAPVEPPAALLEGLSAEGTDLVRSMFAEFEFGPAEQPILRAAAEAIDRVAETRKLIAADGVLLTSTRGTRYAHPLLRHERAAVAQFLAAMRQLGMPAPERQS